MRVKLVEIEESHIRKMEVVEPEQSDVLVNESVGYTCELCLQSDETRHQIWHEEPCPLVGEHGRKHYDDLTPKVPDGPSPELHDDHEIEMIQVARTYPDIEVYNNDVLGYRCHCGNMDEDLFEVVHDARCELADNPENGPLTDHDDVPVSPPAQ